MRHQGQIKTKQETLLGVVWLITLLVVCKVNGSQQQHYLIPLLTSIKITINAFNVHKNSISSNMQYITKDFFKKSRFSKFHKIIFFQSVICTFPTVVKEMAKSFREIAPKVTNRIK